jgi:uncharacterized membrane protein
MGNSVKKMVLTAFFIALVAVVTLFVRIPTFYTKGYLNLGDVVIIAVALLFGGETGFIVGGLGSALADLHGYAYFAFPTLIIKSVEGWVAGLIGNDINPRRSLALILAASILGTFVMVAGYFVAEIFMFGLPMAIAEIVPNSLQGLVGVIGGMILYKSLSRIKFYG